MAFKIVNTIHIPGLDFGTALLDPIDAELVDCLCLTEADLLAHASDADAILCSIPVQPWTTDVLQSLEKCRIIASLGVGFDRLDMDTATNCGIAVTNTPDYCIDEVATHTVTLARNVTAVRFTAQGSTARMHLTIDNGTESLTVDTSAVRHNE